MPGEGVLNPNNCNTFGEARTTDYTSESERERGGSPGLCPVRGC